MLFLGYSKELLTVLCMRTSSSTTASHTQKYNLPLKLTYSLLECFDTTEFIVVDMAKFLDYFRYLRNNAGIVLLLKMFPRLCCCEITQLVLDWCGSVEYDEGLCKVLLLL